jgi:hemolysin activation/secretion protein
MMFTGYSESEYNNVLSPVSFDILGEGLFAGVMVSNQFADLDSGLLSWNLGLTYLDLENSFSFTSAPASDDVNQLSFVVLRAGLQGVLNNQDILPGKSFWSLSALTDAGSASDADLKTQRPGASSGFFAGQFAFTTLQNISDRRQQIDLYLNFASQFASDALPSSLQKAIGGVNSVRGYDEREVFGDHGFHLNSELRFGAFPVGKKGRIEPFTFFDIGYVSSEESLSGVKDSASMQSAGAGFRCIFKPSLDLDFHLGVPFKESADTEKSDARLHFNLDFRF